MALFKKYHKIIINVNDSNKQCNLAVEKIYVYIIILVIKDALIIDFKKIIHINELIDVKLFQIF